MHGYSSVRHIAWDWNGTLLDDNQVMLSSVNSVCESFGRPAIDMHTWRAALCRPLWRCYGTILGRQLSPKDWAHIEKIYHAAYRRNLSDCRLAADALRALTLARQHSLTQSVLSMELLDDVNMHVHMFAIHDFFTAIDGVYSPVSGGSKAPCLSAHLKRLNVAPEECVLIGDVVDDATAAEHVHAACILVATGMTGHAELQATGHPVVNTLEEALNLLITKPATGEASAHELIPGSSV